MFGILSKRTTVGCAQYLFPKRVCTGSGHYFDPPPHPTQGSDCHIHQLLVSDLVAFADRGGAAVQVLREANTGKLTRKHGRRKGLLSRGCGAVVDSFTEGQQWWTFFSTKNLTGKYQSRGDQAPFPSRARMNKTRWARTHLFSPPLLVLNIICDSNVTRESKAGIFRLLVTAILASCLLRPRTNYTYANTCKMNRTSTIPVTFQLRIRWSSKRFEKC